jgi:hypothetical protein
MLLRSGKRLANQPFTWCAQTDAMRFLPILLGLLAGCGITPEQAATVGVGVTVGSIAVIQRSPLDAVYSAVTGRDCSIVRMEQGKSYCRPIEPPPEAPPYCTRSLGVVDCWRDPAALPDHPPEVNAGPRVLTPEQEADRTRRWPDF